MITSNTVFVPKGFSKSDIENMRSIIIKEFYMRPKQFYSLFIHIIKNPRLLGPILKIIPDFLKIIQPKNTNQRL